MSKLLSLIGALLISLLPMLDSRDVKEGPTPFRKYSLNNFFDYGDLFEQEKGRSNYSLNQLFNPPLRKKISARVPSLYDLFK